MTDLALVEIDGGYDISFTSEGDLAVDEGLTTTLTLSVLGERRADASQVQRPELRRGWIGNELADNLGFEQGSLLWLLYQSRQTQQQISFGANYLQDGLQWLVDDGLLIGVEVTGDARGAFTIRLKRANGSTETRYFDLWEQTLHAA